MMRSSAKLLVPIAAVAATATLALACARPAGQQAAAPAPAAASEVRLLDDLGDHHRPITTQSPEAQRYFDQGLVLTYGFNHDLAIRSFREAARLDPDCAMCFWGVALALGPNINAPMGPDAAREAWAALQDARARAPRANAVEQALIQALSTRYAPDPDLADRQALDRAYAEAMRDVHRAHPRDLDVATLVAEALMNLNPWNHWTPGGEPVAETPEIVTTLEAVLARAPDHPGAIHLYIHAVEASPDPARAEAAADRLASLVPASGHLVHMPSHIYLRIGRYDDAIDLNRRAAGADESLFAWCRSQGIYRAAYYPHNIHFIWTAALIEGRSELATLTARRLAAAVPDEMVRALPFVEEFRAVSYVTFARFGRWDALLGEPAPPGDFRYVMGIRHYARALAHLRRGELAQADAERARLEAVAAEPPLEELVFPGGSAATLLRLGALHLAGERAAAAGDVDTALAAFEEAVALQDGLPYTEPPPFYLPVRQALGAVLLEAGRAAEAEAVYRADLARHPKNGWSLYGLSRSLADQGQAALAAASAEGFRHAWARADLEIQASRF
jgi:tetratricopeptide (TPR) repeat protein